MSDYQFDVFISYERDGLPAEWIKEHFLPHFRTWVRMAVSEICNRKIQPIFFDKSQIDPDFPSNLKSEIAGINPGDDWDDALRKALQASRCLVGIWSPPYFQSDWCNIEWQSFDMRAHETQKRLIIAGAFYDGKTFPDGASAIHRFDLSNFTLFGPALVNSRVYEGFQNTIKLLARQVALTIRDAPPFQQWTLAEKAPKPTTPPQILQPRYSNG